MTKEDFINASVGFKGSKFFLYSAEVDGGLCTVSHGEIEDIVIAALDIIEKAAKRSSNNPRYVRYLLYTMLLLVTKWDDDKEKAPAGGGPPPRGGQRNKFSP
jgi:hypothetical protein